MKANGEKLHSDLFKRLLRSLGYAHLYKKLVKTHLVRAYTLKTKTTIPVIIDDPSVNPSKCQRVKKTLENELKKVMYTSCNLREPISVNTFYTAFHLLRSWVRIDALKDEDWLEGVAEKLDEIYLAECKEVYLLLLHTVIWNLVDLSDFRTVVFGYKTDFDKNYKDSILGIIVKVNKARIREFILDGVPRKAYRVGWCRVDGTVEWGVLDYKKWEYKVYIQNHAMEALEKRIDILKLPRLRYFLSKSVIRANLRFFDGKYLLEFLMDGVKFGYFVCTFSGSCIILRTFLFITYDGTPEGNGLNSRLDLDRLSKNYMGLEKLSSYERVMEDEDLKENLPLTQKHRDLTRKELRELMDDQSRARRQKTIEVQSPRKPKREVPFELLMKINVPE